MTGAFRRTAAPFAVLALVCLVRVDGSAAQDTGSYEQTIAGFEQAIRDMGCSDAMRRDIDGLINRIAADRDREVAAVRKLDKQRHERFMGQIDQLTAEIEYARQTDPFSIKEISLRFDRIMKQRKHWLDNYSALHQQSKIESRYSKYFSRLEKTRSDC
jgi:hypothetical protein